MGAVPDRCAVIEDSLLGVTGGGCLRDNGHRLHRAGHVPSDVVRRLADAGARHVLSAMREVPETIAALGI